MTKIFIKDRPCGWGKTTEMIETFEPNSRYVVVVPLLSETERVQEEAAKNGIEFHRPGFTSGMNPFSNKGDHLQDLLTKGKNVVCTHELFYRLGSISTQRVPNGFKQVSLLHDYNILIDEVLDPFDQYKGVSTSEFQKDYLGLGLVLEHGNGFVSPTQFWDERVQAGHRTFKLDLYHRAKSGSLHFAKGKLLIQAFPSELLTNAKTVTVLTFLSEGSYFGRYLKNLCTERNDIDLVVDTLPKEQLRLWRADVLQALTIADIPFSRPVPLSYSGQVTLLKMTEKVALGKFVGTTLMNSYQRSELFKGVQKEQIGITCAKSNWFSNAKGQKPQSSYWSKTSRLFGHPKKDSNDEWTTDGAQWIANTTRGTNRFSDCTHAIYLYDQHPNPQVVNFLSQGFGSDDLNTFSDHYALTELVQWLFRFQIRKGGYGRMLDGSVGMRGERQPTTIFIPSERMRNLLTNWLERGVVSRLPDQTKTKIKEAA